MLRDQTFILEPGVLAQTLREARAERHMTQREVAAELGISAQGYHMWETGAVWPRALHRRAIIRWLNTDPDGIA